MSTSWESKLKSLWKSIRSRYYWVGLGHELLYDLFNTPELSWGQKMWAYRRGFLAYRMTEYGLNEKNYSQYLPDTAYYKLHPINGRFSFWIDDKLTMKYVLDPFDTYLPRYYYHIGANGQVTRLMDCSQDLSESLDDVLELLRQKRLLAAKPISGSRGQGFHKLAYQEDQFWVDNQSMTMEGIRAFLARRERYLLTEWLLPHPVLSGIWNDATSSVRIVVYRNKTNQVRIAGAYVKFGTGATGPVDNISAGGISAAVDIDSGSFADARIFKDNAMIPVEIHPDSGVSIAGTLPFWEEIRTTLNAIGNYLPHFKYMGYDIVISKDSFKIVEINSLPGIDILSCYHPPMADPDLAEFFNQLRQS